jgi:ornithine cyclodeaminase/alanine dehydrogenase-like protein (mu-crystallin family)
MTWVFSNAEIDSILTMGDAIEALDFGYKELAAGRGGNRSRADIVSPVDDGVYALKSMDGVCAAAGYASVRINSDILSWKEVAGSTRRIKVPSAPGNRYVGLVYLFSTKTGEPLAIFPDGIVQRTRVAATTALGARHLSRADSRNVALIGSGFQAQTQAEGICAVRPVERIRCFSPNEANRTAFAKTMSAKLGIPVEAVASAKEATRDADIVLCSTSALDSVVDADVVRPGIHLSTIKPNELPAAAINACDRVAVHVRNDAPTIIRTHGIQLEEDKLNAFGPGAEVNEDALAEIADIIAGKELGRQSDNESTALLNYSGMGYQFTIIGGRAYELCLKAGLGTELPTEMFTEIEHP